MEVKFEMYAEKDPINALVIFDSVKELCASAPILSKKVEIEGVEKNIKLVDAEIIKIIDPVTKIDRYIPNCRYWVYCRRIQKRFRTLYNGHRSNPWRRRGGIFW